MTTPVAPSIVMISPSLIFSIASWQQTMAGMPYSLDTIAAWQRMPPYSVTMPLRMANLGVQYGGSFLYGTGEVFFKQNGGSTGALDFAFCYCYMMGGTTGVVTYLYRKYGNVLVGVIPCSVFAGLFTLVGFTLVR